MAYANSRISTQRPHGTAAFASAVHTLAERFAKYRRYRKALGELSTMSPRELADLGLSQHNLRSAAYEAVYGTR